MRKALGALLLVGVLASPAHAGRTRNQHELEALNFHARSFAIAFGVKVVKEADCGDYLGSLTKTADRQISRLERYVGYPPRNPVPCEASPQRTTQLQVRLLQLIAALR